MDIFLIFFNMKVCCVFSLESPHRGNSNEYTQYMYAIFNMNTKNHPKLSQICSYGIFFQGTQECVKNIHGKGVISATEAQLYLILMVFCQA